MARKKNIVTPQVDDEFDALDSAIDTLNTGDTEAKEERRPAKQARASTSRASMKRSVNERYVDEDKVRYYEEIMNENRIAIPESIKDRMLSAGFHIGWVRYFDASKNTEDLANLHKKIDKMGFEFVSPDEVPELCNGYGKNNSEIYGTMVTEGDLALAKIPSENYEAINEAKVRKTARVSQGIIEPLNAKGIASRSKSFVTRGQRRSEDGED